MNRTERLLQKRVAFLEKALVDERAQANFIMDQVIDYTERAESIACAFAWDLACEMREHYLLAYDDKCTVINDYYDGRYKQAEKALDEYECAFEDAKRINDEALAQAAKEMEALGRRPGKTLTVIANFKYPLVKP